MRSASSSIGIELCWNGLAKYRRQRAQRRDATGTQSLRILRRPYAADPDPEVRFAAIQTRPGFAHASIQEAFGRFHIALKLLLLPIQLAGKFRCRSWTRLASVRLPIRREIRLPG